MQEFIEELKYNLELDKQIKGERKIKIEYVIERLEEIDNFLIENLEYFRYHNKNLTKKQDYRLTLIYDNLVNKGVFKDDIK